MSRRTVLIPTLVALALGAGTALADPPDRPATGQARDTAERAGDQARATASRAGDALHDAFLKGRVVSAYAFNPHVSVFQIDVAVDDGVARLSGAVDTRVERDLAIEIARGVDGITEVKSDLKVQPGTRSTRETATRGAGQTIDDAATTAAVKAKLLANESVAGLRIDVDTKNGVVTLSGTVKTDAERDLAGRIAANTDDVVDVRNDLKVSTPVASN